jgi:hypothetical protein
MKIAGLIPLLCLFTSGCCCFLAPSFQLQSQATHLDLPATALLGNQDPALKMARDFCSGKMFKKLVIEVDYFKGVSPDKEALESFRNKLSDYLDKPAGIQIIIDEEIDWDKDNYTGEHQKIRDTGKRHCNKITNLKADEIGLYILYLPHFEKSEGFRIGITLRALPQNSPLANIVIYKNSLSNWRTCFLPDKGLEAYVLLHESCHILQLPLRSSHAVYDDLAHCCNPVCVLNTYNKFDVTFVFLWRFFYSAEGLLPLALCPDCLKDLEEIKSWPLRKP